jgi:hypothetical protein
MTPSLLRALPLALLTASAAASAAAAPEGAPPIEPVPTHGTWSVVFENDLFRETDRDYTGVIRTREFTTQQGHDEFGVFAFSRAFWPLPAGRLDA